MIVGIGVKLGYVKNIFVKHLIRVRQAAQAEGAIWPTILVDLGNLVPMVVSVCKDFAVCAIRFPSKGRARVAAVLDRLVEVAVLGALPEPLLVEEVAKFPSRYLNDVRLV